MKKIFTLISLFVLALSAQAQVITWDAPVAKGSVAGTYGEDFVLTAVDTDSKMQIDANNAYFGDAETQTKFTHRLKTGGKSGSKNYLELDIPSSGTLKVYVRTGSNSATDRNVILKQGTTELYNAIVKEADAVSVAGLDESDPTKETNVYPIIEVKVATGVVNVTYPVNGINFYGFEFISEGGGGDTPADPTAPTTWDFSQELSENDAENLAADANTWTFDEDNNYWKNVAVLADQNVFTGLTAGNAVLDVTKGLTFARDNSEGLAADKVRIKSKNYVAVNGGKISISLGTLVKDDVVKIRFKGAGVSERSLTVSNTEVVSGSLATEDQDEHEVELKVLKNNVVTITTSNGFQFMAITVNAELPTGVNGVKAEGAKAKATGTVNLAGQQVGADYKGVVIKDGKKVMQ